MLSLAAGMVGDGVVVVDGVVVEVAAVLSRLSQPARPKVAAARSVALIKPAIVRAVVGVVVMVGVLSSTC
jgi:hypothetical protein